MLHGYAASFSASFAARRPAVARLAVACFNGVYASFHPTPDPPSPFAHHDRPRTKALRLPPVHVPGPGGDSPRVAAAAHAADVAHQRDFRDRGRGRHSGHGRGAAEQRTRRSSTVLCTLGVIAATTNIVGGFWITDRMLKMFRREKPTVTNVAFDIAAFGVVAAGGSSDAANSWLGIGSYLVAAALFILVAQVAEPSANRAARRAGRRNRHGAGRHRHAADLSYRVVRMGARSAWSSAR